jgi:hypothetical protein
MTKKINEWLNGGSGWIFKLIMAGCISLILGACGSLFSRVSALEKSQAVAAEHRSLVEQDQEGQIIRLYNEFKDFRKEYKEDMKVLREEMR